MDNRAKSPIWPVLIYKDGRAAIRFLIDAFGFEESHVSSHEQDESVIIHAELKWPKGGGVMLGSAGAGDEPFSNLAAGNALIYVATDYPDALFDRATAAGAEVARELRDEDYGSRGFTVRDPEGNLWSFGTYTG
ncbi:MAG: VOC family protein [Actinomycetota bacterium]